MTKKECIFKRKENVDMLFVVLCVMTIFLILYWKYIFGDHVYAFMDVGSDTFWGYLPFYQKNLRDIKNLSWDMFSLEMGLGASNLITIVQGFDLPFSLVTLFFSETEIYQGILLAEFLKFLFCAIVMKMYLDLFGINSRISLIGSILWTYNGWAILWGQHYWLHTSLCYFTFLLFCLEKVMRGNHKYLYAFIFTMGIYISTNIYSAYTICASLGIYVLFKSFLENESCKKILVRCLKYLASVFGTIMLFLPFIYLQVKLVFGSARLSGSSQVGFGYFFEFSLDKLLLCLGRFFSNEMFGVASYSGQNNLYEDPILFLSILALPAIYFVCKKNLKAKIVLVLCGIALFSPMCNTLFIILNNFRWYYFIIFIELLSVVFFLDGINKQTIEIEKRDILWLFAVFIILIIMLKFADVNSILNLEYESLFKCVLKFGIILILMLCVKHAIWYKGILLFVCIEIIISNWSIVNERDALEKNFVREYIESAEKQCVDYILENDDSLYRISVYTRSSALSDSAMNGYYGLNSYSSLNSKYYIEFINGLNEVDSAYGMSKFANHADISRYNYVIQTLLGVKYIVTNDFVPTGYTLIKEIEDLSIYQNDLFLPIGYSYDSVVSKQAYMELVPSTKNLTLLFTPYVDETIDGIKMLDKIYVDDLKKNVNYIISQDTVEILEDKIEGCADKNNQSYEIYFESIDGSLEITFEMEVGATGVHAYICCGNINEPDGNIDEQYRFLSAGKHTYNIKFENLKNVNYLKIVPIIIDAQSDLEYTYTISNIVLQNYECTYDEIYIDGIEHIRASGVATATFKDDKYSATYNNLNVNSVLFCIPINYSSDWIANVNGEEVEVIKVNDTMCGLILKPGENNIEMSYLPIKKSFLVFWFVLLTLTGSCCYLYKRKNKS